MTAYLGIQAESCYFVLNSPYSTFVSELTLYAGSPTAEVQQKSRRDMIQTELQTLVVCRLSQSLFIKVEGWGFLLNCAELAECTLSFLWAQVKDLWNT